MSIVIDYKDIIFMIRLFSVRRKLDFTHSGVPHKPDRISRYGNDHSIAAYTLLNQSHPSVVGRN